MWSSILKNPNPLIFNITLPAKELPKVPPGIYNPKTFLEVGQYLHTLLIAEMSHRCDPFLAQWKERPKAFREGLPDTVHRLHTRSLSIYYSTHSWPDPASVVDGI